MRIRLLAAAAALTSLFAIAAPAHAVVNGHADLAAHPNVGALTEVFQGSRVLACTGTLISPTVLVTAAHCTAQLRQLGYTTADVTFDTNIGTGSDIACGLVDCVVDPDPNSLHVGMLHTSPDFAGHTTGIDSHDVAVVTFDAPITGITPASLPTAGLLDRMAKSGTWGTQTFTDVGYGWHAVVPGHADSIGLFDGVRRYGVSGSQALNPADLRLTSNAATGDGGACSHDSGGPAFVGTGNVIAGEVSDVSAQCIDYYVYRLDTPSARAFLAGYVALP